MEKPKIISLDPDLIIPQHMAVELNLEMLWNYRRGVFVPQIPILGAPKDLKKYGDFVNYNGHHRTYAAKMAPVKPECFLLESIEDIRYLINNPVTYRGDVYSELIDDLDFTFEAHRDFCWNEARNYVRKFGNFKRPQIGKF